jgi:HAD superfamily hydrolase (TIGR01549 family)
MSFERRALLWDIDGTLIDTTQLIVSALNHVYQAFLNCSLPPDDARAIIGIPLRQQVAYFGPPEDFGTTAEALEAEFIHYYEANRHQEQVLSEAVDALIAGSRAGIRTALVTSKNDEELANTLPRLGIANFVQTIVSADQVRNPKPDPEGVILALQRLGVTPNVAVYVGDTVHDMRAAASAGVSRCAVSWGAAPRDTLFRESPEVVCDHPSDLIRVLAIPTS